MQKGFGQLPDFVWAKKGEYFTFGITHDASGNVYTTGYFFGTVDFDPSPLGVFNLTSAIGRGNTFILKLNASGNFVWAKEFVPLTDQTLVTGFEIKVDPMGNVYTIGSFSNQNYSWDNGIVDFDPGPGFYNLETDVFPGGPWSANSFLSKLDASGNFVWAHKMVNTSDVWSNLLSFELDNANNICLTGYFKDTKDFNPGVLGVFNMTAVGDNDGFMLKLNTGGNFMWAKQFGGTESVFSKDLAIDDDNNIYSIGHFTGTADFNPSLLGVHNITSAGSFDVYISKLNSSGNFVWAKAFSGVNSQSGRSIKIDALNNVITNGYFEGVTDFDPNPASTFNLTTSTDMFISKLDVNGNFVWAKQLARATNNFTIDGLNHIYITGNFVGTYDCDPGPATYLLSSSGGRDFFTLRLNHDGIFQSAFKTGGGGSEEATCTSMDALNNIYTAGHFQNTVDFNPGPGTFNLVAPAGELNSFITKLNQSTSPLPISILSFSVNCTGNNVELYWSTATETNNDHFTVEQSGDGINFKAIGKIDSKGNGNSTNEYAYTDKNPGLNDNYYRLKQTDFDGNFTYSHIINTKCGDQHLFFSVFPNPTNEGRFNLQLPEDGLISIFDIQGKMVHNQKFMLGSHTIHLDAPSGVYLMTMTSKQFFFSERLIVP
jgi:hypothetical protein